MPNSAPAIPNASAGPISDDVLRKLRTVSLAAQAEHPITEAEGALMLLCVGPLCDELLRRRVAMQSIAAAEHRISNVTAFPTGAQNADG